MAHGTRTHLQSHAAFHFLLDYVPNWEWAYRPHGMIQYQFFVPRSSAPSVLRSAIEKQKQMGIVSTLAVLKRHHRDDFAGAYSVDGFSLALDFAVRPATVGQLLALCRELDALQRTAGGRIYAAKDAVSRGLLPAVRAPRFSSNLVRRWAYAFDFSS